MVNEREPRPARPGLWHRALLARGAIGPGKVALMRGIARTGSVSAAARALRMSHARSVKLVAELNELGSGPLVATRAGGEAGGGAALTPRGRAVLDAWDRLDEAVARAAADPLADIDRLLS